MNFDRSIFIGKFSQEAQDLIQKLNARLLELEKAPEKHELLRDILRVTHTLKGSSKIMRFHNMGLLTHKMEDLVIRLQDGRLNVTGELVEVLFRSTDLVAQCVEAILRGEGDAVEITPMCALLDDAVRGENIADREVSLPVEQRHSALSEAKTDILKNAPAVPAANVEPNVAETIRIGVEACDQAVRLVGEIVVCHKQSEHHLAALNEVYRLARKHAKQVQQIVQENDARIRQEVTTELAAESQQILKGLESILRESGDDMAMRKLLIHELHEDVLKMRMLPLSTVFDTFPRAVRDMAKQFQKQIDLRMTGAETMLDKKIIEQLSAPLIHLLRNCSDHGIEPPEERIARGKPATGIIALSAHQKSGQVEITITDDGRGVQIEKLKQILLKRGLLTAEYAQNIAEADLLKLLFLPGVSTSDTLTDISGRGVGMDIVKTEIERLKGSVSFSSTQGQGACCMLTLPMTLTKLRSLIIASQEQLFAIPMSAIEETLLIPTAEFIDIGQYRKIQLRDQPVAVVDLAEALALPHRVLRDREHYFIIIARDGKERMGFIVDEILDEQDVVVKPLPRHLQHVKTIAGATISSDNTVILIVHLPEIIQKVNL